MALPDGNHQHTFKDEGPDDAVLEREELAEVANEFAHVRVAKVRTRNGERLELSTPKLGYVIRLDALELESLTWQSVDTFSRFLSTPFGPHEAEKRPT